MPFRSKKTKEGRFFFTPSLRARIVQIVAVSILAITLTMLLVNYATVSKYEARYNLAEAEKMAGQIRQVDIEKMRQGYTLASIAGGRYHGVLVHVIDLDSKEVIYSNEYDGTYTVSDTLCSTISNLLNEDDGSVKLVSDLPGSEDMFSAIKMDVRDTYVAGMNNDVMAVIQLYNTATTRYKYQVNITITAMLLAIAVLAIITQLMGKNIFTHSRTLLENISLVEEHEGNTEGWQHFRSNTELDIIDDHIQKAATTINESNEQLQEANRELLLASERKNTFIAYATHELNSPFSHITMHMQNLMLLSPDEDSEAFFDSAYKVLEETFAGSKMLDELARTLEPNWKAVEETEEYVVEISELATSLLDTNKRLYKYRKVQVQAEIEPDLTVCSTERDVERILRNYIQNGLKYTPEKDEFVFKVYRDNDDVVIETRNKSDITDSTLQSVYEIFVRGTSTKDNSTINAGIGLAVVKEIAKKRGDLVNAEKINDIVKFTYRFVGKKNRDCEQR